MDTIKKEHNMFAIFGLGNDGKKYENTYHNMGFLVLDAVAKKYGLTFSKKKCHARYTEFVLEGKKVMLFKPTTFMNDSGKSVREAMKKFKLSAHQVLVVYDDVDIKVGSYRLREKGSAGSHNGMKSIVASIGTTEFARLRVGIGAEYYDLIDFVLSDIRAEHMQPLADVIVQAVNVIEQWVAKDGNVNEVH